MYPIMWTLSTLHWTVICKAISAVLNNYLDIINTLEQITMAIVNSYA